VKGVIWPEECPELAASFKSLLMSFGCETDTVIWDSLVYVAVFVAFRLSMSNEDD
jgi:hypothetical protein